MRSYKQCTVCGEEATNEHKRADISCSLKTYVRTYAYVSKRKNKNDRREELLNKLGPSKRQNGRRGEDSGGPRGRGKGRRTRPSGEKAAAVITLVAWAHSITLLFCMFQMRSLRSNELRTAHRHSQGCLWESLLHAGL